MSGNLVYMPRYKMVDGEPDFIGILECVVRDNGKGMSLFPTADDLSNIEIRCSYDGFEDGSKMLNSCFVESDDGFKVYNTMEPFTKK